MPNYNISLQGNYISIKDGIMECIRLYCPVRFYCELSNCGKDAKLTFKTQDGDYDILYSCIQFIDDSITNLSIEGMKAVIDKMIKDCVCCAGETEMNIGDVASGGNFDWFCRKSDQKKVLVSSCKNIDGSWDIKDLDNGAVLTPSLLASDYIENCLSNDKQFQYICDYRDDTDTTIPEKKRPIVSIESWLDPITNTWCHVLQGEDVNVASNLLTISNFTKMSSERLGNVPVIKNDLATKKAPVLDVCAGTDGRTVTIADLQADIDAAIAARTAKNPPLDGYEWALLGLEVNQHPAKKKLHCDLTDADGDVTSNLQIDYAFGTDTGQFVTAGDTPDTIVKELPEADACGCLNDRACLIVEADFTKPLTLPAMTGLEICPILVCVVVA